MVVFTTCQEGGGFWNSNERGEEAASVLCSATTTNGKGEGRCRCRRKCRKEHAE